MEINADLLIHSAAQLCVMPSPGGLSPSGPQRGRSLGELGLIEDGALAACDGRIVAVGRTSDLRAAYIARHEVAANGCVVIPGFVDPHTHLVWAGDRAAEFEQRIAGASYMQILAAGGGILSTVRHTRQASLEALVAQSRTRLDHALAHGTTTLEVKTGYGLDTPTELKQMAAISALDQAQPVDLVPTFLGAHAVPPEYKERGDAYVDLIVEEMLPAVVAQAPSLRFKLWNGSPRMFCDVFCEEGAFDLEQTRRVLAKAKSLGLGLKLHVDEFKPLGGSRLGVELGATSVDHFVTTPPEEVEAVARSSVVAVSLPGTPFGLAHHDYSPARLLLEHGGALALASDCNPGTCWCESMQFMLALACRYLKLTPGQALAAATLNAAYALGLGQQVGSLEVGKLADAVILDVPDYRHLGYHFGVNLARMVVKRGHVVWKRDLPLAG